MIEREKYKSVTALGEVPSEFSLAQCKYDGHWTLIQVERSSMVRMITRTGRVVFSHIVKGIGSALGGSTFLGERLVGTNWSLSRPTVYGSVVLFDCLHSKGANLMDWPYGERYLRAAESAKELEPFRDQLRALLPCSLSCPIFVAPLIPNPVTQRTLNYLTVEQGFEGVVFRNPAFAFMDGHVLRYKREFTMDYVVMDVAEGKGRLEGMMGYLVCGLYNSKGELKEVCRVGGGFSDEWRRAAFNRREQLLGRVIEVKGNQLFNSGALRHPRFVRVRDDKDSKLCTSYQ